MARLDKDVVDFPKGFDTLVGERGITLSGGQKQRTALARAVAMDPRVLVLDDSLSAVDTYTEEEILQRLKQVRRGRTCLIVAHRVSTVRDSDVIFVLARGALSSADRMPSSSRTAACYAELHRKQLLEEELEAIEEDDAVAPDEGRGRRRRTRDEGRGTKSTKADLKARPSARASTMAALKCGLAPAVSLRPGAWTA